MGRCQQRVIANASRTAGNGTQLALVILGQGVRLEIISLGTPQLV